MNIKPLGENVVIEPVSQEEKTKSGIFLPQSMDKERPEQGKIIAIGTGKTLSSGKKSEIEIKVGDMVLFNKFSINEIKVDDKEYLITKQEDILAVLEK